MRTLAVALLVATLAGCAVYQGHRLDSRYGPADPGRYDRPRAALTSPDYWRDIKPILDRRCVVCHGCYDAPCQLSLGSYEGVTRGAHKERVYDMRLTAAEPARLFFDAHSSAAWRKRGFHPVLNERDATPEANREASVLYRILKMKHDHPAPADAVLPDERYDFSLNRSQQCTTIEGMDRFERKFPEWGMPFALPALPEAEYETLTRWIEAGAPYREPDMLPDAYRERIAAWEAFLNSDDLKTRLMARYIYEHWFIGSLYFDDLLEGAAPAREYFELVRSRTPPGEPVDVIATRRPYDDPGVERVYYRLRHVTDAPLTKTHIPYALSDVRMERFREWFFDASYEVAALPSYDPESASNPFVTFQQLPVNARYRFLIEDARFMIKGFIKGPVCRGQVALNVINDHFWVIFVDPAMVQAENDGEFLARERHNLRLPAEQEGVGVLLNWRKYAKLEAGYLEAKARYLNDRLDNHNPPTLDMLWDGDGENQNAALTVFRHFDSASVVHGLHGERPQTAWVIGYPLLERIHYLLVAGFDVYGNVGHQVVTRLYMDFLRMEGELTFLGLLPRAARQSVRDHWYRNASPEHVRHLGDTDAYYAGETGIEFGTEDPLTELYGMLKDRMAPVQPRRYALSSADGLAGAPLENLAELSRLQGRAISYFAETAFMTVRDTAGEDHHFTLISNNAHSNVAELFGEDHRRLPDEDTLSVLHGFVGAYPNAFFRVDAADLPAFVAGVRGLAAEDDYRRLLDRYGIRRTDERFWPHSDALVAAYEEWGPADAGLFDYSRFDNR